MMITVSRVSTSTAMPASASVFVDFGRTGDGTMKIHQWTGELSIHVHIQADVRAIRAILGYTLFCVSIDLWL